MHNIPKKKCIKICFPFLALVILLISFLLPAINCSRPKKKTYIIGFINPNPGEKEGAQGFLANMPKFNYIEGKNVTYIKCESKDSKDIDNALKDMVAKKVDLIFAMTTPATQKAKQFTEGTNIPVVFVLYNALSSEIVKSVTHPGGNLTGIQLRGSTQKAVEWLLTVSPKAKHIFVPVSFDTGAARHSLEDLKEIASKLGIKLTISEIKTLEELNKSVASMPKDTSAVFLLHSWLVGSNLDIVLKEAITRKIPVISAGHVDFEDGLTLSYGPRDNNTGWQAARLANIILQGNPPADIPVENADFVLGINLKTAQSSGIKIPDEVLMQADNIIR